MLQNSIGIVRYRQLLAILMSGQVIAEEIGLKLENVTIRAGVIEQALIVLTSLQDAASVSALLLTTEAMIAEKTEKAGRGGMPDMGGMGGMPGMM